jgi:hypothetical protein
VRPSRPNGGTSSSSINENEPSFDANAVANSIKNHEQFTTIESKIIHASGDWYNKIAFVLWFVDQPLTSGQVHRALQALHIRSDLPTISKTLKKHISNFLTPNQRQLGGAPATYHLSARAKSEFEKWLLSDGQ